MEAIYTAVATTVGGRNGHIKSSDGVLDFDVHAPKELGGPGGAYTNPEQLFAAGYSACYNSALMAVARRKRLDVDTAEVTMSVSIGRDEDRVSYKIAVRIDVKLFGISESDAEELVNGAHALCPYSKAIKGNVDVELHYTLV